MGLEEQGNYEKMADAIDEIVEMVNAVRDRFIVEGYDPEDASKVATYMFRGGQADPGCECRRRV